MVVLVSVCVCVCSSVAYRSARALVRPPWRFVRRFFFCSFVLYIYIYYSFFGFFFPSFVGLTVCPRSWSWFVIFLCPASLWYSHACCSTEQRGGRSCCSSITTLLTAVTFRCGAWPKTARLGCRCFRAVDLRARPVHVLVRYGRNGWGRRAVVVVAIGGRHLTGVERHLSSVVVSRLFRPSPKSPPPSSSEKWSLYGNGFTSQKWVRLLRLVRSVRKVRLTPTPIVLIGRSPHRRLYRMSWLASCIRWFRYYAPSTNVYIHVAVKNEYGQNYYGYKRRFRIFHIPE